MPEIDHSLDRLGLGTVQFGLDYGISNKGGQNTDADALEIVQEAGRQGLRVIDTAPAYGDSELALGRCLPSDHGFKIVTKTPIFDSDPITQSDVGKLHKSFKSSLTNMAQESLYGLLVHHAEDLLTENGHLLWNEMQSLRDQGLVQKIGVSAYDAFQIDSVLDRYSIDIIQLPVNVFDQRLITSGHLVKLRELGVEIHARSAFLQGLLLMSLEDIPGHFESALPAISRYQLGLKERNLSLPVAALSFVKDIPEVDCVIIGVNSRRQLIENIDAFRSNIKTDFAEFAVDDKAIIDPTVWRV